MELVAELQDTEEPSNYDERYHHKYEWQDPSPDASHELLALLLFLLHFLRAIRSELFFLLRFFHQLRVRASSQRLHPCCATRAAEEEEHGRADAPPKRAMQAIWQSNAK